MGGHGSQVIHQRDRQPGLVCGEHAAGRVRPLGEGLAGPDHDRHGPSGPRGFDLVVSEAHAGWCILLLVLLCKLVFISIKMCLSK